jgi:hypothetical protein
MGEARAFDNDDDDDVADVKSDDDDDRRRGEIIFFIEFFHDCIIVRYCRFLVLAVRKGRITHPRRFRRIRRQAAHIIGIVVGAGCIVVLPRCVAPVADADRVGEKRDLDAVRAASGADDGAARTAMMAPGQQGEGGRAFRAVRGHGRGRRRA